MEQNNLPAPVPEPQLPTQQRLAYPEAYSDFEEVKTGPDLKRYLKAVIRYKWLVLLLTVAGTALAAWISGRLTPKYEAQAMLWLQAVADESDRQGPIRSTQVLRENAWVELLRSEAVLEPVVREQRLYVRYEPEDADVMDSLLVDTVAQTGAYRLLVSTENGHVELRGQNDILIERARIGEPVGRPLGILWTPPPSALNPGREVRFSVTNPAAAAITLAEELTVNSVEWSNFLTVRYEDPDPARAAAVVNSVTSHYIRVATDLKRVQVVEVQKILEEQLRLAEGNLQSVQFELNNFLVRTATLPSQPPTSVAPGAESARTNAVNSYFDVKARRDLLIRDRTAIERALLSGDGGLSIDALSIVGSVQQSPEVSLALRELTTKRAEVRGLLQQQQLTPEHPRVVRANSEVINLEREVIPRLARNLANELDAQASVLDGMVTTAAAELQGIPPRAIAEAELRRSLASAADIHNDLRQRYQNARLAAETAQPDVSILTPAAIPQTPNADLRLQILLAGFAGSLSLGLGLAVMLELMDRRVRYAEQVSDGMQLTILGAIPDLSSRRKVFSAMPDKAELVEALRGVRLNLTHAYGAAGPVMVTVTSPGPGDGKTFLTSNLAMTFAELGMRTLIVDADTRRGTMHRVMDISRRPGLTDYLGRKAELQTVIRPTGMKELDVIACGTRSAHAPELLSSPYMGDLLAYVRVNYDVVLIDSPPLGAGVDPLILATATGNVALVMRTGRTDRTVAEAKLAILDRLPVRVLGAVLNGISGDVAYKYYSYLPGYEAGEEDLDEPDRLLAPV